MNEEKKTIDCCGKKITEVKSIIQNERGIQNLREFLRPSPNHIIPPSTMRHMVLAGRIMLRAIQMGESIGIHFDTDTDGITSGSIMHNYLRNFISEEKIHDFTDIGKAHGLDGLTEEDWNEMEQCDVIIIVDSLDNHIENYKKLKLMGKEVIILDHHDISNEIPYEDYATLISSNWEEYDNHALSGAGVCLKFCMHMDEVMNTSYAEDLYDLAAVGNIADMMNVSEGHMETRAIIYKGLNHVVNPVLQQMIGAYEFTSDTISYHIAPKLNALGRTNRNKEGYQIFEKESEDEITKIMAVLELAKEDQDVEVNRVLDTTEPVLLDNLSYMFVNTPYGISGLVANQLVSRYHKPAIVLYQNVKDDNTVRGSARCPKGPFKSYCLTNKVGAGGHEQAFGVWFTVENKETYTRALATQLNKLNESASPFCGMETIPDIVIRPYDITEAYVKFCKEFNRISGLGSPSILIQLDRVSTYMSGNYSKGKHTYIEPGTTQMQLRCIEWNLQFDAYEAYEKAQRFIIFSPIGTLTSGMSSKEANLICDHLIPEAFKKEYQKRMNESLAFEPKVISPEVEEKMMPIKNEMSVSLSSIDTSVIDTLKEKDSKIFDNLEKDLC